MPKPGRVTSCTRALIVAALFCAASLSVGVGGAGKTASGSVSFTNEIAPLLAKKCLGCHGVDKNKGDYQLHTFAALLRPGTSRVMPVVPGRPDASRIYQLITSSDADERMPQKSEALAPVEIDLVARWIREGATFDGGSRTASLEEWVTVAPYPPAPEIYRFAHPVSALAWDPAKDELICGGYHELLIFDAASGVRRRRIGQVAQRTYGLAYSADGQWLAAATGTPGVVGEVKLFHGNDLTTTRSVTRINDVVLCVAFSPDGKQLAAGGSDSATRIFDIGGGTAAGKESDARRVWEQHTDWIMALAFTADGKQMISASRDKSVRAFDVGTGELALSYLEHKEPVTALALSRGGKEVWSASRDGRVHVWTLESGKQLAELKVESGEVNALLVASNRVVAGTWGGELLEFTGGDKPKLVRTLGMWGRRSCHWQRIARVNVWRWEPSRARYKFGTARRQ